MYPRDLFVCQFSCKYIYVFLSSTLSPFVFLVIVFSVLIMNGSNRPQSMAAGRQQYPFTTPKYQLKEWTSTRYGWKHDLFLFFVSLWWWFFLFLVPQFFILVGVFVQNFHCTSIHFLLAILISLDDMLYYLQSAFSW